MKPFHFTQQQWGAIVIGGIVLLAVGYGVGAYAAPHNPSGTNSRYAMMGGQGGFAAGGMMGGASGATNFKNRGGMMGAMTVGQIVKNDGNTITISVGNGDGSRLVMLSASTTIAKAAPATTADLTAGVNVMVAGSPNSDGSIAAQSIQIR